MSLFKVLRLIRQRLSFTFTPLKTNCLLTRHPLIIVHPPHRRSFLNPLVHWGDLASSHGYEVFCLRLRPEVYERILIFNHETPASEALQLRLELQKSLSQIGLAHFFAPLHLQKALEKLLAGHLQSLTLATESPSSTTALSSSLHYFLKTEETNQSVLQHLQNLAEFDYNQGRS